MLICGGPLNLELTIEKMLEATIYPNPKPEMLAKTHQSHDENPQRIFFRGNIYNPHHL